MSHTVEEDFEHFLSYSGLRSQPQETIDKLFKAFVAAWEPKEQQKFSYQSFLAGVVVAEILFMILCLTFG
jgi:hypothetical protein